MDQIFWIPIGIIVVAALLGLLVGSRSRGGSAGTGLIIGLFLGLMAGFPLLAIGLSNT